MAEMQNSNPTILNAADLPTRLRPTVTRKSEYGGIFTSALPLTPVDFESDPPSDSEDDNLLEEPIDEQEIYGKILSDTSLQQKAPEMTTLAQSTKTIRSHIVDLRPGTSNLAR